MNLKRLLVIHATITLAAGLVLIFLPAFIPNTVDLEIKPGQYFLCYFLGAAEIAIAYLSFFISWVNDSAVLRIVSKTFILFHGFTAGLEFYALAQGISAKLIANIVLRVLMVLLFYYYGIYKNKDQSRQGNIIK